MAELYYPTLLTNKEAFPANIHFTFYERKTLDSSELKDQIHLYMPEQFGQPSTISWDSQFAGGKALINAGSSALDFVGKRIKNQKGQQVLNSIKGLMNNGIPASDLVSLTTGSTMNPFLAQLFRGVDFRNFQYTFKFVPFSIEDCNTIQEIITIFRRWALPSGPEGGASSIRLNYPGEVDIEYQFMDGANPYIHRFKRSVITSIDIDYTGAGMWTMMRNGFPTETSMNIRFSEIQIVVREDVNEGY